MKSFKIVLLALPLLLIGQQAKAHCEIPCGIYDDSLRIALLYEHITTIEKSMHEIIALEASGEDANQLVRWVINKEEHAKKMQEIISQYFMHQRIKPKDVGEIGRDVYIRQLELMHRLSIYAMKAKQSTDTALLAQMRDTLHLFEHAYFPGEHSH